MSSQNKSPILDIVASALEEERKREDDAECFGTPRMRPSTIGTPCLRRIYYKYLKTPKDYPTNFDTINLFERGDAIHTMVKRWLRVSKLMIDYRDENGEFLKNKHGDPDTEFPVNDEELSIKNAKIDGIGFIKDVPGLSDGLWVYEIKSINWKYFRDHLTAPKEEHKEQATIYAFLLEEGLKQGKYAHIKELDGVTEVQGIIFIYINRESDFKNWKEFHVPKQNDVFLSTVSKIVRTKEYVAKDELPPKTVDTYCNYCDFRKKCKLNFKVEKSASEPSIIPKKTP